MPDATTYTTIGAILAISASIFNAVGYTVQKKGHNRLKEYNKGKIDTEKKRLIKEKVWAWGFSIYLIGGLLNAVSLFYAPQSLVLPLSAITLVANTILATKVLSEPFFRTDIFGIVFVMIGSVLAVMFGPRTAGGEATMNDLKKRWGVKGGDYDFFLFFIALSTLIVFDYLLVRFYERKNANDETVTNELKHGSSFLLISYCLLAGYFGALAFLFLKSFTEFIGSSISSQQKADENATNWYSYFTLIGVIITNFALEFFRQRGLSYFHAVYVVPINQVVLIVMGTVMGGLYFKEFNNMQLLDGIMFIIAILMTVCGVFVLAFNSGNVSEKTEANVTTAVTKHALTLSFDQTNRDNDNDNGGDNTNTNRSNILPNLANLPSLRVLQTSPSLPITRNMDDEIPDLPPPGMDTIGAIARIHGLHRSMASWHFTKDNKPFYLDKNSNKLSVLSVIGVSSISSRSIYKKQHEHRKKKHQEQIKETQLNNNNNNTRHIPHSHSLPTYSNSSLDVISLPPNQLYLETDLEKIKEKPKKEKKSTVRFKDDVENDNNNNQEEEPIEIVMKESIDSNVTDYIK